MWFTKAEEPLPAGGSCLLGAINLSAFVKNNRFDFEDFANTVKYSVQALNKVLDEGLERHPLQEQRDTVRDWRQIGLGIMGLADMLIQLGIEYGSPESIALCDKIGHLMARTAIVASAYYAHATTCYDMYDEFTVSSSSFFAEHIKSDDAEAIRLIKANGLRNSQLLTIAPTGSISTMIGVSGGIEPIFANSYERTTKSLHGHDEVYKVYTPIVKRYMDSHDLHDESELPHYFVTSATIPIKRRIDMQSVWQRHIDASISSTVNLPNEATVEDVKNLYMYAWEKHLKGVTVYRAGCKRAGILNADTDKPESESLTEPTALPRGVIVECSNDLIGKKRKIVSGCGALHVLAFFNPIDGSLQEVYFNKGSTGGCVDRDTEYFNGVEWKKISEYNADEYEQVLQYNEDGTASLTYPISYIVNDNVENLKHFHNTTGLDMVLSEDHRMYLYKNYIKYMSGIRSKLSHEVISVKDFLLGSRNRHVPTTFSMNKTGIPLNNNLIRLLVAIYADGTFDGHKIVVNVKKERKKIRLRHLLTNCDIGWTEKNIHNTEYTVFYIHPTPSAKQWFIDKQFTPKWYDCNDDQLKCIVDECVYWDGSTGEGNRLGTYFTSKKVEADFIQFALTRLGFRATISLNNGTSTEHDSYRVRWTTQNVHGLSTAIIDDYETVDGKSYCFTVPSGLLVLRRNGKIFITGNCGNFMTGLSRMVSLLCRAGVDIMTIKDQLDSTGVCPSYATRKATKHDTSKGSCCPMAIGNALVEMYNEMQAELDEKDDNEEKSVVVKTTKEQKSVEANVARCPECGEPLLHIGGCVSCPNCAWTKCE